MKVVPFLLALFVFISGAASESRAQTTLVPSQKAVISPSVAKRPDAKPSWLFVLETKTQWLLLLQNNADSSGAGSTFDLTGADSGSSAQSASGLQNAGSTGSTGNGGQANTAQNKATDPKEPLDDGKFTIILEGNTNDLPFIKPPGKALPGKGPSAPDS